MFPKFKPVEYVRDAGGSSVADNAHDYPLQLAAGIGIPGMLMLYGIFVWAGVRSFSTVFRRSSDPTRLILGAFWAAAAGYLVQLLFGISVTGNTFLLWIALARRARADRAVRRGEGSPLGHRGRRDRPRARRAGHRLPGGLSLLADNAYLQAQTAPSLADRTAAARSGGQAQPAQPHLSGATWALPTSTKSAPPCRPALRRSRTARTRAPYAEAVKRSFANAETALKDAIAFVPDEYDNYVSLADLYNVGGGALTEDLYQSAIEVAEQGLEVAPFGTAIRVQLARASARHRQDRRGREDARVRACASTRPAVRRRCMLADVYQQQGKPAKALAVLRSSRRIAPGQPGVAEAIQQLEAERHAGAVAGAARAPRGGRRTRQGERGNTSSRSPLVSSRSRCVWVRPVRTPARNRPSSAPR